jgi:hypothetical protein
MRTYTVTEAGDYLCDCGLQFSYPPRDSAMSLNHSSVATSYSDFHNGVIRESGKYICGRKGRSMLVDRKNCPLAKASLISGIIGLVSFGILSIPALILGFSATMLISNPFNNYKGNWMAVWGILLGFVGTAGWGLWVVTLL